MPVVLIFNLIPKMYIPVRCFSTVHHFLYFLWHPATCMLIPGLTVFSHLSPVISSCIICRLNDMNECLFYTVVDMPYNSYICGTFVMVIILY